MRYIFLLDQFKDALLHSHFYPRWLPDLCGGYGYPTFVFYQPGFFYFALPFSFLPGYPFATMSFALITLLFLGGYGAYQLGKVISNKVVGFFASVLFLMTPYLYVNLYVRGDLSELMAMLLLPWPIFFLVQFKNSVKDHAPSRMQAVGLFLSLSVILISHPAVALFFVPIFCIFSATLSLDLGKARSYFLSLMLCFIVAAFLFTSPYWVPLVSMKKYVNFSPAISGLYSTKLHAVHFFELFKREWGFGVSRSSDINSHMSFQLGLPHFALASLGFIFGRRNKLIVASYTMYILLIVLMLPISSKFWEIIPILSYVQFPWRILSATALLQIICLAGLCYIPWPTHRLTKIFILLCVMALTAFWYSNQFQINPQKLEAAKEFQSFKDHRLKKFHTLTQTNEYMPNTVKTLEFYPRGDKPLWSTESGVSSSESSGSNAYHLKFVVKSDRQSMVRINQLYLKGWRVEVDSKAVADAELEKNLSEEGLMQILITPGEHQVVAYYEGPPGWRVLNSLVFVSLMFVAALVYFLPRINKRMRYAH